MSDDLVLPFEVKPLGIRVLAGASGIEEAACEPADIIIAAIVGVIIAHVMFELDPVQVSTHARIGPAQWFSEVVATFGLLTTIIIGIRHKPEAVPALVAMWVVAGYWFTSSTNFANPAVTIARALTDTFAGIRPDGVLGFIIAQLIGATLALYVSRWLLGPEDSAT